MKKLLLAASILFAISGYTIAQTEPAKTNKSSKKMESKMVKSDSSKAMSKSKKWDKKNK